MKAIRFTALALLAAAVVSTGSYAAGIRLENGGEITSETRTVTLGGTELKDIENVLYNNDESNADLQVFAIDGWSSAHEGTVAVQEPCTDDGMTGNMYKLGFDTGMPSNVTTRFAFGYGYKSAPGGKSFGLTNESFMGSALKLDIKLSDISLYDTITFRFGYNNSVRNDSSSMGNYGVFIGKEASLKDYAEKTTEWQTVEIPLSIFKDEKRIDGVFLQETSSWTSVDVDWQKITTISVNMGTKQQNTYAYLRNVKFTSQAEVECEASCALYADDVLNADDIAALAGKRAKLAVSYKNGKTSAEDVLYAAALYKDGVMTELKAVEPNFGAESENTLTYDLFDIPGDTAGYSLGVLVLDSLSFSRPLTDWIFVR